jgi:signal transduction histidine kinase
MAEPVEGVAAAFDRVSRRRAEGRPLVRGLRRGQPGWRRLLSSVAALKASLWMLAVILLALALTVVLQATSVTAYTPSGRTMLDTTSGLVGAFAAIVFAERAAATRDRRDLLVAVAFGVLSATNLFLAAAGTLVDGGSGSAGPWIILAARVAGSGALLCVLLWPNQALEECHRLPGTIVAGVAVLAVATLNYLVAPSLQSTRLVAGDILELGAFMLILYGCLIELRAIQRRLVDRVAVDERRRMARDMHDGLAQELAFIASHSQRLGRTGDDAVTVAHLKAASERALQDSRTTIAVLTSPDEAALDQLVTGTAQAFTSRFGVEVDLDLEGDLIVDAQRRNALLRILHEAMTNAIRHGSAGHVLIRLRGDGEEDRDGISLRIADDGGGFDVPAAASAGRGLGLISMGERADTLGGSLHISSSPGSGTVVEVGLP